LGKGDGEGLYQYHQLLGDGLGNRVSVEVGMGDGGGLDGKGLGEGLGERLCTNKLGEAVGVRGATGMIGIPGVDVGVCVFVVGAAVELPKAVGAPVELPKAVGAAVEVDGVAVKLPKTVGAFVVVEGADELEGAPVGPPTGALGSTDLSTISGDAVGANVVGA